jgi:hypothetical protein
MPDDEKGRVGSAYGANYRRLVDIKGRYDPGNLFHMNQNIARPVSDRYNATRDDADSTTAALRQPLESAAWFSKERIGRENTIAPNCLTLSRGSPHLSRGPLDLSSQCIIEHWGMGDLAGILAQPRVN